MKYAVKISEIVNAFSPEPLETGQMDVFYCNGTMEYRTDDKYNSPFLDIFEDCQHREEYAAFLLSGHRGCGKSTELNKMSEKLTEKGYHVKIINCGMDLDIFNIAYSDLFIIMGMALLEIIEESGFRIKNEILDNIIGFWDSGINIHVHQKMKKVFGRAGKLENTKDSLTNILDIFAVIKTDLKFNEEMRKEYHKKTGNSFSKWVQILGDISDEIAKQATGKRPVVIFDGLDRLDTGNARALFYNHAAVLSCMKFPVIYTFPVTLLFDKGFMSVENYFKIKIFPFIKTRTVEDIPFRNGINIIYKIIEKRADLSLFELSVLEKLVWYTGGSLKDLFYVINSSAKRAMRRHSGTISEEDASYALEELKTSLIKRIEEKDYEFLLSIYNGNKKGITDRKMLLQMLQASVVLIYGTGCWYNLHPLVIKFFKEQGLIV